MSFRLSQRMADYLLSKSSRPFMGANCISMYLNLVMEAEECNIIWNILQRLICSIFSGLTTHLYIKLKIMFRL